MTLSSLESFVRDYLEITGGDWEEVEPQVYDVLVRPEFGSKPAGADESQILRIAFDPEALPEHPGSQLASFGTPLINHFLQDAMHRGRFARLYMIGLNLYPADLPQRLQRSISLPVGADVQIEDVRPQNFGQAVFWFEATFTSDQKEQLVVPMGMDLHTLREVRHIDELIDPSRLAEQSQALMPDAHRKSLRSAYHIARQQVVRTVAAQVNARQRSMTERVERQIARMKQYYADLQGELVSSRRGEREAEQQAKIEHRREALCREESLRIAELKRKSTLNVSLRILNLLMIQQPKLQVRTTVEASDRSPQTLEWIWNPLPGTLEATSCPACGGPTFSLEYGRMGQLLCPECAGKVPKNKQDRRNH